MREIDKISESLFEKIRDRFEDVSLGDENAKATSDPEKARFFNFDYSVDGTNHGNITMSIIDETSLKVYFSKNITDDLEDDQKKHWYSFLRELREFAKRNLLSFEPRDITRSTLKHRDIQQQSKADSTYSKDEVVAESRMYGTLNRSFESFGPVRIKLAHTKPIMDESHGARSRNIAAVFVENDQGERFRLPFNNLTGARAMARHVSAGGVPTDELGCHITEMVNEMTTLRPFVRGMSRRTFEDTVTTEMVESAFGYHALLKNTLKKMKGKKGYTEFKESFKPALVEDEANVAELKELFVKKTLDERIEQALPLVHKAYNIMKENNNPYAQQFENWAGAIAEGAWALPQTEEDQQKLIDLLSEELPVGVDAQNATNALYNIFGDDQLFDRLEELADVDPQADARDAVMERLMDVNPEMYQAIIDAIGDSDSAEPAEGVNEGVAGQHLSDQTAQAINSGELDIYNILAGHTKVQPGEQELLQAMYDDISSDTGLHGDDDFEDIIDRMHDQLQADYGVTESAEETDQDDQLANIEAIQSAIIRRILHNINDHSELLMKAGPDGVMNASLDVASFHAPMEEIGSSDVSIMVREVYREVGVDYPEMNESRDLSELSTDLVTRVGTARAQQLAPHVASNSTSPDRLKYAIKKNKAVDNLLAKSRAANEKGDTASAQQAVAGVRKIKDTVDGIGEAKDTIKYDPKTGKLTGWEHEGDWKKQTKKDPVGKIHHMSDVARRRTEKMAKDETLEETFERLVNEGYDTRDAYELDDPKHPDFKDNWEEYKSKNPDAKLADFIAHLRSGKNESIAGDDHVNKDVKMKRMGAKELGIADKFKIMPSQMQAMKKGDSEDDLLHYNKLQAKNPMAETEFNEAIEQMRRIAGLK